jgi:integrase
MRAERLVQKPAFPVISVNNARTGFFEDGAFRAVLGHLPEDVQPVAEFMYYTGWRKSEVLGLTWDRVDCAGILRLDTSKTGEGRVLPFAARPERIGSVRGAWRKRLILLGAGGGI